MAFFGGEVEDQHAPPSTWRGLNLSLFLSLDSFPFCAICLVSDTFCFVCEIANLYYMQALYICLQPKNLSIDGTAFDWR